MNCHLERDWPKGGYNLYLWEETPHYKVPFVFQDGRFVFSENNTIQFGEVMPPTMFIPDEVYGALRPALIGEAIANDDALADTRKIRDRLLVLVEQGWQK
jgi:hypothetical protein